MSATLNRTPISTGLFRLNGFKFNMLFGILALFIVPSVSTNVNLYEQSVLWSIIGFVVYAGHGWAFAYKTRIMRARAVRERMEAGTWNAVSGLPPLGCLVTYGFIMQLVFRVSLVIFALIISGVADQNETEVNGWAMTIMIICVLFEMLLLGYVWVEARLSPPDDEHHAEKLREEASWKKLYLQAQDDASAPGKEMLADFFLFVAALMFTHAFWTMSNSNFIESIDRSFAEGDPGWSVLLSVLIANFILCLFMLVPIRLAYWVGESISVINARQRWQLRFSLIFAGLAITSPVFVHFVRVYVNGN